MSTCGAMGAREMNNRLVTLLLAGQLLTVAGVLMAAQEAGSEQYDALPLQTTRSIRFVTNEGSWLDLDLSPDGRMIVFEMLGDLYTLPISGGKAGRITSGAAYDALPRFSPDGNYISFVSDRDGGDNIWIANLDGTEPISITSGKTNLFRSLEWSPDGYVVASRGQSTAYPGHSPFPWRGYPASGSEIVFYDPRGGNGIAVHLNANGVAMAPAFGSDPRYLYASVRVPVKPSGSFDWTIVRFDRETAVAQEIGLQGRAIQPVISPDNTWLIYGSPHEHRTGLRLRHLKTGKEHWLLTGLRRDAGLEASSRGLMPGAAFTPDSRAVILQDKGRIWRVEVPSGKAVEIPFAAEVNIPVAPLIRFSYRVEGEDLTVAQIRGARPSPDGKRVVFTALNKLWLMSLSDGRPHRLTTDMDVGEHQPTWSPDGRYIAYVGWREGSASETGGSLRRVAVPSAAGPVRPEQLTRDDGYYEHPVYSPDGGRIVANRELLQIRLQRLAENFYPNLQELSSASELVWIPSVGGKVTQILSPAAGIPMFTRNSSRIWLNLRDHLDCLSWDGADRRTVLTVPAAAELLISPSGKQVLALAPRRGDAQVYLIALPSVSGITVNVAYPDKAPVPVRKMTTMGANFPVWAPDEESFHYSLGRFFFTVDALFVASPAVVQKEIVIRMAVDKPKGTLALRGARIVTSGQKGTIEKGDLVVTGDRIAAVGRQGEVTIPADAHIIDISGKTVIQGYVDTHGHIYDHLGLVNSGAVLHNQPWPYLAALAYGVTTNRDPGGSIDEFSYADLVAYGEMLGPRIYSTGPHITSLFNISSYRDAQNIATRYADFFGTHYIKQYATGERQVRQWLNMAAAEKRLTADVEPHSDAKKSLADAMDGYAELAHAMPLSPLYNDVIQLLTQTGISYTATLMTMGPSSDSEASGDLYFYTRENFLGDVKLRRFVPRTKIDQVALHQENWYAAGEYAFADYAADVKKMIDAGVNVGVGSHGNFKGPGYHWELEMHASGGIAPQDILRAATAGGARAIGLTQDIGSLEAGKLADLQVLDRNPLDDIRNVRSMRYVMKNGRLYDSDTLDEIWPRQKKLPAMWWSE